MPGLALEILKSAWATFFAAAPWILFGLLMAGLLHVLLPAQFVRRAMGGNGIGAVLKAALIGAPLPLCSCGVIPTALYLRREGAGKGPVLSFMISTPETSLDSIGITYALMGPLMAAVRPVAALISAVLAGVGERLLGAPEPPASPPAAPACKICAAGATAKPGRMRGALSYAAVVLMRDLAPWLLLGVAAAGVIDALVPKSFFQEHDLGSGLLPMILIALLATPMYMCSTSSTPVAAALVLKGLSPGAALVFLLVGPATNAATMIAVWRFLGRRSLAIYLVSMIATSFALGLGLDLLAGDMVSARVAELCEHGPASGASQLIHWTCATLLGVLVLNGLRLRLSMRRDSGMKPGDAAGPTAPPPAGTPACQCARGNQTFADSSCTDGCCRNDAARGK